MVGVYNGETLETMERITNGMTCYFVNTVYKNDKYNIYYYINSKGYMHVLRKEKEHFNQELRYVIKDYILSKDNYLRDKGVLYRLRTVQEVNDVLELLVGENIA